MRTQLKMVPALIAWLAMSACEEEITPTAAQLDPSNAALLRGGARVDVLWPPNNNWAQSFDDLAFQAEITDEGFHEAGYDSANIGLWSENAVGAGKHAYTTLTTTTSGNDAVWQRRVLWPTQGTGGGKPDLSYRYFWPETNSYFVAGGNSARTDMYLHGNVKVAEIQLFTVSSGGSTATANWFRYDPILNAKDYWNPDNMDNLTDGIYRRCGDAANNDDLKHWQVRLRPAVKSINVTAATDGSTTVPCTDLSTVRTTFCPGQTAGQSLSMCAEVMECMDDMIDELSDADNDTRVSVFHLTSTPWGSNTSFVWSRPGGWFTGITLNHMNDEEEDFSRLFSHEMGHRILALGDLQQTGVPGTVNARCDWDPDNGFSDDIHPLMCTATPGRFLYAAECTTAYAANRTNDWNSQ